LEKKGVAAVASSVVIALLAGLLLGGTMARPPPVTMAETTVEVPVKHQPAPYSALAYTACIYDKTLHSEGLGCKKT
jgi:hypothetical protein